jgi:hypothetical protein
MIPARGLTPGDEAGVRLRRVSDVFAHACVSLAATDEEKTARRLTKNRTSP